MCSWSLLIYTYIICINNKNKIIKNYLQNIQKWKEQIVYGKRKKKYKRQENNGTSVFLNGLFIKENEWNLKCSHSKCLY